MLCEEFDLIASSKRHSVIQFQPYSYENATISCPSALRSNSQYVFYYIFWSKFVLVEVIPYFVILVLNSLIISKIWKSNQFRRRFVVSADYLLEHELHLHSLARS